MSAVLIVSHILNNNSALLSKVPINRQFMVTAKQGEAMPYLVINQVSGVDEVTLSGQGEYQRDRIQIDIVAATFNEANNVSKLVRGALVNTIKATITQGTSLRVKDVDIIATGMTVTDWSDNPGAFLVINDYHVRWRYK